MSIAATLAGRLVPSLCCRCAGPAGRKALCPRCAAELRSQRPIEGSAPPGIDRVWSAVPYEGAGRDLMAALKFRRWMRVAEVMADLIAARAPAAMLEEPIVPVPAATLRSLRRGFDPGGEVAYALYRRRGTVLLACLSRRGGGRQVGRPREARLADPPRFECQAAPPQALLVDDVTTTGATLAACARALRGAGTERVDAITFARRC